jgi:hypothetical protein
MRRTQSKNKAKVIKYLEGRAEDISRGLGYLNQGSSELSLFPLLHLARFSSM